MAVSKQINIAVSANTAAAQREVDQLRARLAKLESGGKTAAGGVGSLAQAAGPAAAAIAGVTAAVVAGVVAYDKFISAADRVTKSMIRDQIATNNLRLNIAGLSRQTAVLMDTDTKLHTAMQAQQSGLVKTQDQYQKLTDASAKLALMTGQEVPQAMETIVQALSTGRTAALKKYGIVLDLNKEYEHAAEALGKNVDALTDEEKMAVASSVGIEKLSLAFKDVNTGMDEQQTKLLENAAAWRDFKDNAIEATVSSLGRLVNVTNDALSGFEALASDLSFWAIQGGSLEEAQAARLAAEGRREAVKARNAANKQLEQESKELMEKELGPELPPGFKSGVEAREKKKRAIRREVNQKLDAEDIAAASAMRNAPEATESVAVLSKEQEMAALRKLDEADRAYKTEMMMLDYELGLTPEARAEREHAANLSILDAKIAHLEETNILGENDMEIEQAVADKKLEIRKNMLAQQMRLDQQELAQQQRMQDALMDYASQWGDFGASVTGAIWQMAEGSSKSMAQMVYEIGKQMSKQLSMEATKYTIQAIAATAALDPRAPGLWTAAGVAGAGAATFGATAGIAKAAQGSSSGSSRGGPSERPLPSFGGDRGRPSGGSGSSVHDRPSVSTTPLSDSTVIKINATVLGADKAQVGNALIKVIDHAKKQMGDI